jgi:hypothetical protein
MSVDSDGGMLARLPHISIAVSERPISFQIAHDAVDSEAGGLSCENIDFHQNIVYDAATFFSIELT